MTPCLTETMNWSHEDEEQLIEACRAEVEAAAAAYLALPPEPPQAMFDSLYETLPQSLAGQCDLALSEADRDG